MVEKMVWSVYAIKLARPLKYILLFDGHDEAA